MGLQVVAQGIIPADAVDVLPADPLAFQDSTVCQICYDPLDGPFRDPHRLGHVPHRQIRMEGQIKEDVGMVGKEVPLLGIVHNTTNISCICIRVKLVVTILVCFSKLSSRQKKTSPEAGCIRNKTRIM